VRAEKQKKVIADMARAVAAGMAKPRAMLRAFRAGAFWRQIGGHFGISQQAAYETAKKARQRGGGSAVARGQGRRPRKPRK
jgi:hypothetical protein